MTKRDMRRREQKQHLGTAANRDAYEQQGHVVVQDNRVKSEQVREQGQEQKGGASSGTT